MENPTWGYTRIRGALANLGHEVGRNTIKRILKDAGMEPAPERGKRTQWKTFIREHLGAICATDFFTVEVLTMTGIVRYFVLFVIDLKTRQVHIAGIAHQVYGKWVEQVARNLTDPVDGFLKDMRYLIHDRDPVFTKHFTDIPAVCQRQREKPARVVDVFPERLDASLWPRYQDRLLPGLPRTLGAVMGRSTVDTTAWC
jgi:putative transposase